MLRRVINCGPAVARAHTVVSAELASRSGRTFLDCYQVTVRVRVDADEWARMNADGRAGALRRLHTLQLRCFYDSWLFRLERLVLAAGGYPSSSSAIARCGFEVGDEVAVFRVSRVAGRGGDDTGRDDAAAPETMLEWFQGTSFHGLKWDGNNHGSSGGSGVTAGTPPSAAVELPLRLTFGSTLHEPDDHRGDSGGGSAGRSDGGLVASMSAHGLVSRALTAAHGAYSRLLLAAAASKFEREAAAQRHRWLA